MKKSELINGIESGEFGGSLYTKGDIIQIVQQIEDNSPPVDMKQLMDVIIDNIKCDFHDRDNTDLTDLSHAEFHIGPGNRLEVEEVGVSIDKLGDIIEKIVIETFTDFKLL